MMKNNKIKKITAVAVSVIMAAMMLSACGSGSPSKSADGKTIITVGDWPSKDGIEKDNMEDSKAKFEAANSDIEVKPDSWQFELKSFYAKAAGGQLPTVYKTNFTEAPQIIASGYSSDLTAALEKYKLADKFNKNIMRLVSKDGKGICIPICRIRFWYGIQC